MLVQVQVKVPRGLPMPAVELCMLIVHAAASNAISYRLVVDGEIKQTYQLAASVQFSILNCRHYTHMSPQCNLVSSGVSTPK